MKDNKFSLLLLAIVIIMVLFKSSFFGTVFTPNTPDATLTKYVNNYYFPVIPYDSTKNVCDNSMSTLSSTFASTITSVPTSSSNRMFYSGKYYQYKNQTTVKTGSCSGLGSPIMVNGASPFSRLLIIPVPGMLLACKDNSLGGYTFSRFVENSMCTPTKCPMTYFFPNQEVYSCKAGKIYTKKCGSTSYTLVETCKLGCEQATLPVDTGTVQVVKCVGDYKPDTKVCSSDGKAIYTTDSSGKLTSQACLSCSSGICKPLPPSPPTKECKLLYGGSGTIDIFIYNDQKYPDWSAWIYKELQNQTPYNEFSYNIYHESVKGACDGTIKMNSRDTRLGIDYALGYIGWGYPSTGPGIAGYVYFDTARCSNYYWHFLLFHELGHVYTHAGHTSDGSIMDSNGGNGQYSQAEINTIRGYLSDRKDG